MEPFIGQICQFGGNFAPRGWALCDGQLLDIASHTALFSILGTIYGGDGRTNFKLPDLRGRVALHEGNGPGLPPVSLGQITGRNSVTLSVNNMPSHNHVATSNLRVSCRGENASEDDPTGAFLATGEEIYSETTVSATATMHADTVQGTITTGNNGGNLPFDPRQPYSVVNFIIATQGTYPSRS